MKLLLTGFETFGDWATNPSWDALVFARDHGMLDGLDVALARIPVAWATAWPVLEQAVQEHRPDIVISFGLHGGMRGREAAGIYLERTARNRDAAAKADNAGEMRNQPVVPGAPETLPSTLDTGDILAALQSAGYKALVSDDAGAYLCNHLFYRGAHGLAGRIAYGFVHVPPVEGIGGVQKLDDLARAVALIARAAMRGVQGGNRDA